MLFQERELQQIAKRVDLGAPQVRRVLGSLKIPLVTLDDSAREQELEMGLNVFRMNPLNRGSATQYIDRAISVIREYQAQCPAVVSWVLSGGCDPSRVPEHITRSTLVHACRTAGRLRARFLRESRNALHADQ
jgi:hypothetical protein